MHQEPNAPACESTNSEGVQTKSSVIDVSSNLAASPTLQRLLDEVRNDELTPYMANYNRQHNRHNR